MIIKWRSKERRKEDRHKRLKLPHKVFYWWPTRVNDSEIVWLQTLVRKHNGYGGWEYSTVQQAVKQKLLSND